jgi:hypothetical protein
MGFTIQTARQRGCAICPDLKTGAGTQFGFFFFVFFCLVFFFFFFFLATMQYCYYFGIGKLE